MSNNNGCCDQTHDYQTIREPEIIDGTMTGTVYAKDCAGNELKAMQTAIASCADLAAGIDEAKDYTDTQVATKQEKLLDCTGAPLAVNSQVVGCVQFNNYVSDTAAKLTALTVEDTRLDTRITTEVTRLDTRIDTLDTKIDHVESDLTNAFTAADNALSTRIDNNYNTLDTRITNEVSTLNTKINTDIAAATATLNAKIDADIAALALDTANKFTTFVQTFDDKISALTTIVTDNNLAVNQRISDEVAALQAQIGNAYSNLKDCTGNPIADGTQVATCIDLNAQITELTLDLQNALTTGFQVSLKDCSGAPLGAASVPTCDQMNLAICTALSNCDDDGLRYNAEVPPINNNEEIPTTHYGTNANYMGQPDYNLAVNIVDPNDGKTYLVVVPGYKVREVI